MMLGLGVCCVLPKRSPALLITPGTPYGARAAAASAFLGQKSLRIPTTGLSNVICIHNLDFRLLLDRHGPEAHKHKP